VKKLFLTSYFPKVAKLFPVFAGGDCAGKKVVFIPTASVVEKAAFYVKADKKALEKLGMIVDDLEVSTAAPDEIKTKLSDADYIFVSGGNTFYLLQEFRRTGADKLIMEHINNGKIYIGSSAGSIIASRDIGYAVHMDSIAPAPDLKGDFSALSVVDFYVVPHCGNFPFKRATAKIIREYSDKLDLRPINNNQVVVVDGNKSETLSV
jgi:dipeptidase E